MARFDFKRRRARGLPSPPLGLVVPVRAVLRFDAKGNVPIDDELRERENLYRTLGRPPVIFEDYNEEAAEDWRQ
jgi:hypothetical protein